jgi:uncharacterized protein YndB with AHSA1/START domain
MAQLHETNQDAALRPPPLRLSRIFPARRETVFKAWSFAEHVKRWFAPEGCTVSDARVEMRVGGPFEVSMQAPGVEHRLRGKFVEVTPPSRLVIDFRISDADEKPQFRAYTELDFAELPGGTRLDVTQTYTLIDPSVAWMIGGAPEGWRSTLDKLEREVARLDG